ncbi:MAG: hypothetical protein HOQ32_18470 [Lysobacter sp.]|nr:hypothetical protein [Lysobacter sp.]
MNRSKGWWAAGAAVVIVAGFAAPIFHKAFELAMTRAAAPSVTAQAAPGDPAEPIEARGSQPKQPPVSLTIAGEIFGLASGAAPDSILVRVGSRSFAGQIQGGGYVATIDAVDRAEMVSVEVVSQRVRYRSIVGSFDRLIANAGGDRRVDAVELPTLRVSPWSSALAFLVRHALQGRDALSNSEFERTTRAVSGADMFQANHLLATVAAGTVALPSGYADGQQWLEDENAYRNWIDGPAPWADPEAVFAQSDYAPLRSLSELSAQTLLMAPVVLDKLPFSSAPLLLLRNTDGSYTLHEGEAEPGRPDYAIQLQASGDLVLTPQSPRVIVRYEGIGRTRMTLGRIVLRRVFDGDRHDLWATRMEWTRSFPDDESRPPELYYPVTLWSGSDLQAVTRTQAWTAAPSRRALPWVCPVTVPYPTSHELLAECDFVEHRFDPGGSGGTEDHGAKVGANMQPQPAGAGVVFGWNTDGAQLRVQTPQVDVRYWSIDGDDDADTVIYLATGTSSGVVGQTLVGVGGSLAVDPVPFQAAQAQGTWTLGTAFITATAYPSPHYTLEIQRNADSSGEYRENSFYDGVQTSVMRWDSVNERVYDIRTRARFSNGTRYVSDCASAFAAGAQTCAPVRIRYFRPLRAVGGRLYGIEELHTQFDLKPPGYTGNYDVIVNVRSTFQQCLAGACLTPPALRLPAMPISRASQPATLALPIDRPRTRASAVLPRYLRPCSDCGQRSEEPQAPSGAEASLCPACDAEALDRQRAVPQLRQPGSWRASDAVMDAPVRANQRGETAMAAERTDAAAIAGGDVTGPTRPGAKQ